MSQGPVWDEDDPILNYVMHPYFGGVYYTVGRHSGLSPIESTLYSFTMSTFFWEYGVEAFAEVPSWQDIIVTPIVGSLIGEIMYEKKQHILSGGGYVMGSKTMGNISLFFLDPVGHIHSWIQESWHTNAQFQFVSSYSFFTNHYSVADTSLHYDPTFIGVEFTLRF